MLLLLFKVSEMRCCNQQTSTLRAGWKEEKAERKYKETFNNSLYICHGNLGANHSTIHYSVYQSRYFTFHSPIVSLYAYIHVYTQTQILKIITTESHVSLYKPNFFFLIGGRFFYCPSLILKKFTDQDRSRSGF